jgi:hypothetical protein
MKNTKYIYKVMLLMTIVGIVLSACDDDNQDATPVITNVRVVAKDSTVSGAEFGLPIAIQGTNLGSVRQVFFNDIEAELSPPYITDTNILLYVPDIAPSTVTNKITLVTASGKTTTADFTVLLPEPEVWLLANEFAQPGTANAIFGNYFYLISEVRVGDTPVEFVVVNATTIAFMTPDDVGVDKITVTGEGGTTVSSFSMNETEGNMINFDIPATGWGSDVCWGDAERINPDVSEIDPVAGRYTRIKQSNLASTGYQGDWVVSTCWFDFGLDAGPATEKVFRFEANIVESWKMGKYEITIGTESEGSFVYNWKPWDADGLRESGIKTNGWRTFIIPLELFTNNGAVISDASKIRDLKISFNNADSGKPIPSHYVTLDNFRLIDK